MNYPGSELAGCFLGVDFLKDQIMEKQYAVGKKLQSLVAGIPRSIVPEQRCV